MNQKTLGGLLLTAVVLVAVVFMLHVKEQPSAIVQSLLYPQLSSNTARLDQVVISTQHSKHAVILQKNKGHWGVVQRNNYPVNTEKLKALISDLASAVVLEKKTRNPVRYSELQVTGLANPESKATEVTLNSTKSKHNTALLHLLIGKVGPKFSGRYVRKTDSEQSLLIDKRIAIDIKPSQWLARKLFDVRPKRVRRVVYGAGTKSIVAERAAATDKHFKLTPIPSGFHLNYAGSADVADSLFVATTMTDVMPLAKLQRMLSTAKGTVSNPTRVSLETYDGLKLEVKLYKIANADWMVINAEYLGNTVDAKKHQPTVNSTTKNKSVAVSASVTPKSSSAKEKAKLKLKLKPKLDVAAEVAVLNKKLANWAFKITTYQAKSMRKTVASFVAKNIPKKKPLKK